MLNSLRFRLLLMFGIVLVAGVGLFTLLMGNFTTREFYAYIRDDEEVQLQRFVDLLGAYYNQQRGWKNPQPLINQMGEITGARIALVDGEGQVIAASDDGLLGRELEISESGSVEMRVWVLGDDRRDGTLSVERPYRSLNSERVGAVYVEDVRDFQDNFIASMRRSLILALMTSSLVALGLTFFLSHQVVKPIEKLTHAARQMEKGNFSSQVSIKTHDEIGALGQAFNAMAGGLIRLEQLRQNMVTDVAHELRTPLSNIRGYLEALQDGVADPNPEIIDLLHEEAMLLIHLVDALQELALAEAGKLRLNAQVISVGDLLRRVEVAIMPQLALKDLHLKLDLPADLPLIQADPDAINQVLRNLLSNAIKYSHSQGTLGLKARHNSRTAEIVISVQDQGIGIPQEDINNVFERFYRVDASRARYTGGVGLGLAIVKQLVEAHGGRVWAESELNTGSTFYFSLPIHSAYYQPKI